MSNLLALTISERNAPLRLVAVRARDMNDFARSAILAIWAFSLVACRNGHDSPSVESFITFLNEDSSPALRRETLKEPNATAYSFLMLGLAKWVRNVRVGQVTRCFIHTQAMREPYSFAANASV